MLTVANDLVQKGDIDKARKVLDNAQEMFPYPNYPNDIRRIYVYLGNRRYVDVIGIFKTVYGEEAAKDMWKKVFEFYRDEINYLSRFSGEKAVGVRGRISSDVEIVGVLFNMARMTLADNDLAQMAANILSTYDPNFKM